MKKIIFLLIFLLIISCKKQTLKNYDVGYIETPIGEMYLWLYEETPLHKDSFIELANLSYWDSLSFNRVIENFVIQGGCPDTSEGFSNSPYLIKPEFNPDIKHIYGAVGMGRDDNPEKLSAGCQFYIVHDTSGISRLDQNYTIFGQVFKGFNVLDKIATLQTDSTDTPLNRVSLKVRTLKMSKEELKALGGDSFLKNIDEVY
ncbi:MAG: peptidylprolyl isomerase [Flavobacterium sp.]|jgi:peptidyl-prolyl cis-trans isomerase B (cyclophilin B)|nr:peptidylprolyl isomerase [Flavobacterium sp.]